ncbi:MAG: primosomal protein N' [Deltaproteobacteria bacterium]|nr:primosomal protein N' [Deltaproteobacteria bacterium]
MLFEVAVRSPLRKLFTYEGDRALSKGVRVKIPFGSRELIGFVWREAEKSPEGLKKILEVFDEESLFDEKTLQFYERASQYYGISLGELLATSLPKKIRDGKSISTPALKHFVPQLPALSPTQQKVFQEISKFRNFSTHLLMGETGSGKTEIYLHLIERILCENAQALLLVPEISLTPQLEDRLSERLGAKVSVFHSQMTEKKRVEAFERAASGQADVFLGARSALMLPFKNLKAIFVDEEHDGSFKQSERGPYHARDLALLRAKLFDIPVVLGSATPSLESYFRAEQKESHFYTLPPFFEHKCKAQTQIIDLKDSFQKNSKSFISVELQEAIEECLEKKEQSLLFLNRRGSASQRLCVSCGSADQCKHCSVTLTIHHDFKAAVCHWCGYQKILTPLCETCGQKEFFWGGIGTKEVETIAKERFPEARIARLDRDQVQKRETLATTLRDFADGKIDILVGTQMISKGIDISKLSLVGVILADQGWGVPDFRGTERSFQLLKQLKGRGGRRGQESKFLVQTLNPEHPVFKWLDLETSYESFASEELKIRQMADLPPYSRLALFSLSHKSESDLERVSYLFLDRIQNFAKTLGVHLVGPAFAPISRLKGVYRMQILAKAPLKGHMSTFLSSVLDEVEQRPLGSGVKMKLDRDPYQFM